MDLINLILVFGIIIAVMSLHKPLALALISASAAAVILYQLPFNVAAGAIWRGATEWSTIEVVLVFYTIMFLTEMLRMRRDFDGTEKALNGLFHNSRVNASLAPFLLGLLPGPGTVLMCGPIVRKSAGDHLNKAEQASITSYFRHISESFLPTYTDIFISISLTQGLVTPGMFVTAMIPIVLILFLCGYLVYLRRIPQETQSESGRTRTEWFALLVKSIWTILLIVLLILIFNMKVELAVLVAIILNIFIRHFQLREIGTLLIKALDGNLLVSTWVTMIFKEILAATGVIGDLPGYFERLPIPEFVIFALIFFVGAMVSGSQAIRVLMIPTVIASLREGQSALPIFVLCMCMSYASMQLTPLHICLLVCSEDFKVTLGAMIRKTIPIIMLFILFAFVYYGVLTIICA